MKRVTAVATLLLSLPLWMPQPASAQTVEQLLAGYATAGGGPFSAAEGELLWQRPGSDTNGSDNKRRCSSCHGTDLGQPGRHQRTRKPIAALSPSVEPGRLSDPKKVKKWLLRNCKWTWGRVCTVQEKGDLLSFIQQNRRIK